MAYSPEVSTLPIGTRTIQKVRIRILSFVFLLYVIAFLDRVNIGFAALTMNKELGITSQQFGLLAGIFFLGYFLFEVPSNFLLYKIGERIWIARILISWGTVAVLTGFVQTVHQLYLARFLLGLAEAGYGPGVLLYLTYWFRRQEQAQAIALFLTGVPLASFLGAPLSGLILDHIHWLGVSSWRWLLILQGIPAVVGGFLTYFFLPNRPAEAKFLNEEEKDWINSELLREERQKLARHRISAIQVFTNGRVWHLICAGFAFFFHKRCDNFLDTPTGEITARRPFQHHNRLRRDDSKPCGDVSDVLGFSEFRPQAGAEISCCDSSHHRRDSTPCARHDTLGIFRGGSTIACGCRRVQFLRPLLRSTIRVPDGTFCRLRHRFH
jgi:hypothetical protein